MKKILALLLCAVATMSWSGETVMVVYGWSPSDAAANFHRTIVAEANKIQDKYTFVFDSKPGAGASIAAQYTLNNTNVILASSSAFFIRPNFFPNESYDIRKFRELLPECSAPFYVISKKYKSWKEVPTDAPLTIGVSGLGITTHLVSTEIAKKYPNLQVIPFKSTTEVVVNVISGITDFGVNFNGDSEQYVNSNDPKTKIYVLGVTGAVPDGKIPNLTSLGFPAILDSMNSPAQLIVPATLSESKFKEWREIMVKASKTEATKSAYHVDHCVPLNLRDDELDPWFTKQINNWKHIASGVTLQ